MSRLLLRASFAFALTGTLACSGSSGVTIPESSTTSDGGSSTTDGGPAKDSGIVCAPCTEQKPSAACTTTDPCGCGPWICPDSGASDACTWSATTNPCGPGKYCYAPGCGQGSCVALGDAETTAQNEQCGCDGVTYWNATVAAAHGMSLARKNACNGGAARECSLSKACPVGATCNVPLSGIADCLAPQKQVGTCWRTPATCPTPVGAAARSARVCGQLTCTSECGAVQSGQPYVPNDNTCPAAN